MENETITVYHFTSRPNVELILQAELDFNGQQAKGLGPLSYEVQRGMYLHPTYAVTRAREPLEILDVWMWAREPKNEDGKRGGPKESQLKLTGKGCLD